MKLILMRFVALCMAMAIGHQLVGESRLREGIRLLGGLLLAKLMIEVILILPSALFS